MNLDEEFRALADRLDEKEFGRGAPLAEIEAAERALQVRFPDSFRTFLNECGWAGLQHLEFFGLGPDVPRHLNLLDVTIRERTAMQPPLPRFLVPVRNDGAGNNYCLDTRQPQGGECPVVFWCHEDGAAQTPKRVSASFRKWLFDEVRELTEAE